MNKITLTFSMLALVSQFVFASENTVVSYSLSDGPVALNTNNAVKIEGQNQKPLNLELSKEVKSAIAKGTMITIDTRDREACLAVKNKYQLPDDTCQMDEENPYVSTMVLENSNSFELKKALGLSNMNSKDKTLLKDLRNVSLMGASMIGIIYALPESISKWDHSELAKMGLLEKYKSHVAAGPVVDEDDWAVNYIGHPLSGAAYYTLVRHQGFTRTESFMFSVCMSTFFWEYGLEAFAEIPSLQDLIITPVIGSLFGEIFYQAQKKIDEHDGKVLGSRRIGKVATIVLNPAGALSDKINRVLDKKFIKDSQMQFSTGTTNSTINDGNFKKSYAPGIQLKFQF